MTIQLKRKTPIERIKTIGKQKAYKEILKDNGVKVISGDKVKALWKSVSKEYSKN